MELTTTITKQPRVQRTEQEIFSLMEEFESNDAIGVKDFCELYEISDATFYNWQKRYRNRNNQPSAGFVSLQVSQQENEPGLFAEVNGIRIYREVSAAYLKELR